MPGPVEWRCFGSRCGNCPHRWHQAHARELLARVLLIDGHNDLPRAIRVDESAKGDVAKYDLRGKVPGHADVARLRAGGLGGDFDGNDAWPTGLADVSMYPNLFAEIIRRGCNDEDLALLAGGNLLRVLRRTGRRGATAHGAGFLIQVGCALPRHA